MRTKKLKFRNITITTFEDNKILSWNPLSIKKINIQENWIEIDNERILRKDFHYSYWRHFISQLTRIFEIEEVNFE